MKLGKRIKEKTYVLRFREINRDIFNAIKIGKKKVETRASTIKFKNVKKGDMILFLCGKSKFQKKIKGAYHFKNINGLLKKYPIKKINLRISSRSELEKMYSGFPGYRDKIEKSGLISMEI